MSKRYCLMKLVDYDREHRLETWRFVKIEAEKIHELDNFMCNGFRIWDSKVSRVVKTNLNLDCWLKNH
ncbi:UNVERIFIED_CONTAM: hypothetical protein ABIC26_002695 [Paenibacillus sp. PvR008]